SGGLSKADARETLSALWAERVASARREPGELGLNRTGHDVRGGFLYTRAAMTDSEPHLLVVDDDLRLRELLRRYLSDSGFRVTGAADAAEARAQLASFAFDLVVLDVMMPGESGLALTRSLRGDPERQVPVPHVPVLLLTAMGEPEDRVNGLEHGADDYLVKPFQPRELVL